MKIFNHNHKLTVLLIIISFGLFSCTIRKETTTIEPPPTEPKVEQPAIKEEKAPVTGNAELVLDFNSNNEYVAESPVTISNIGSKNAINVNTKLITHYYSEEKNDIKASIDSPSFKSSIDLLKPQTNKTFNLGVNLHDLYSNYPKESVALEFRTTYINDSDHKQYIMSTVYYLNPQGKWVDKNNPSLKPKGKYNKIIWTLNWYLKQL
ncbi:MAG: hypothetical protein GTO02_15075 [Candidatus Dadabacteria bacterium]|nr:hypothetical protein [Candidatus Dadabacteria bacterium]NIQ15664.1 hypothetical protein [Candidatus Dadabacteria bacterium]